MKSLMLVALMWLASSWCTPLVCASEDAAFDKLMGAKSLRCVFTQGAQVDWSDGTCKTGDVHMSGPYVFDSIDHKEKKARAVGNQGAGDVVLVSTPTSLTFIEESAIGNIIVTTVFPVYKKGTSEFICVQSRHMNLLGNVLVSQLHGTCQLWE
jgi:hypothetical protein